VTTGSPDVVVAVLDTGVDLEHPDLRGNLVPGTTFWPEQGAPMDYHGHGTHVAGIIAARLGNTEGGAGVAPGCKIMPVKVMGPKGPEGKVEYVAAGLVWAADHGAKVANLSLGDEGTSTLLRDAVAYALSKDVVVVAASGNFDPDKHTTTNTLDYPAGYPGVMAVGATDSDDQLADFSFWGSWLDVVAPGVEIYSTVPGNAYRNEDGTSMASPFVAGVAALVRSRFPELNGPAVKRRIEATATDLGAPGVDDHFGHGRVDAAAAVGGG
jgi:type VII secretion-associated serine protease mycosin